MSHASKTITIINYFRHTVENCSLEGNLKLVVSFCGQDVDEPERDNDNQGERNKENLA